MKLWTPRRQDKPKGGKAACVTARGTIAFTMAYGEKELTIEVTPALARKISNDLRECCEAVDFDRRRQDEFTQIQRDILT